MTERMSEADWQIRHFWLIPGAMSQNDRVAIAIDWKRARAEEERLAKRVAELESELAIKTGDSDAATK